MAEYIKQEMCDLNGTGEKPVYYRMKIQRNMDMEDFVERITYPGSGLSRGSVIQVMTTVVEHLAYCMAEGQSVTLDGIGTFTPRLGVAKDKEIDSLDGDEPKRNARSIEVNGINYRADKELIRETNLRCDLRRGGISRVRKSPFTEEERRTRALDYLDEHPFLRIQDYMAVTGLKRSSATVSYYASVATRRVESPYRVMEATGCMSAGKQRAITNPLDGVPGRDACECRSVLSVRRRCLPGFGDRTSIACLSS